MNKTPSILVDTGFEVDQNGLLNEIDVPNVVSGLTAPAKVSFLGTTLNWIPSTTTALQELNCPNTTVSSVTTFSSYTQLKVLKLGLGAIAQIHVSLCSGCTSLTTIEFNNLISIEYGNDDKGAFNGCTALQTVNMPKLATVNLKNYRSCVFKGCFALETLNLPSFSACYQANNANSGLANNCTGLTSITLGSVGHPVSSLSNYTFAGCTQSGLIITIYTSGGAALSGSPWGATNATIVYEEA